MKALLVIATALVLLAVACFSFGVGDIWAASFKNAYFAYYIH
jgi:hypothetical protein